MSEHIPAKRKNQFDSTNQPTERAVFYVEDCTRQAFVKQIFTALERICKWEMMDLVEFVVLMVEHGPGVSGQGLESMPTTSWKGT